MADEVSTLRLNLLRVLYLLTFVGVGMDVWPTLINPGKPWDPIHGIAFSFWAAYSALMGLGIRYPLAMLPLLILQLFYKSVWLIAVALPLSSAGPLDPVASGLTKLFIASVVASLIVIPWRYVLANYVRKTGDRWRGTRSQKGVIGYAREIERAEEA